MTTTTILDFTRLLVPLLHGFQDFMIMYFKRGVPAHVYTPGRHCDTFEKYVEAVSSEPVRELLDERAS